MGSRKIRTYLARATPIVSITLAVAWAIGQVLRDRHFLTALMFYFPTPVLVVWLSALAAVFRSDRRLHLILLIAPLVILLRIENHWVRPDAIATQSAAHPGIPNSKANSTPISSAPIRLLHWNLARGVSGWEKQWRQIEALHPDIIVLSEIPEPFDVATVKGFNVLVVDGMAVACHGLMTNSRSLVRGGALDAYHVTCLLSSGTLEVMIADMTSRISIPRDPFLRPFISLLQQRRIDIAVGDFNAPRRSLAFCELPEGYCHAYDAAGAGWSYTWPVPVPFLAIDQCIIGPRLHAVRYDLVSTLLSDHRLQIVDFERLPDIQ